MNQKLRWHLPLMRKFLLALLSTVMTLILLVISLEMVLNTALFQTKGAGVYGEYPARLVPTLNSLGFRDDEHAPRTEKALGTVRIVILGDSFTYGQGVADDEIYPRLLSEYAGPQVEIISLAKQGWSTADQLEALREIGLSYEPDMVLIGVVTNDPEPHQSLPDGLERDWRIFTRLPFQSRAFHLLDDKINRSSESWRVRPSYADWQHSLYDPDGPYWPAWQATVAELATLVRENNIPTFAFVLPTALPIDMDEKYLSEFEALADGYRAADIPTKNLWPLYVERFEAVDYKTLMALPNDQHPGPELHAFYAEVIWQTIEPELSK